LQQVVNAPINVVAFVGSRRLKAHSTAGRGLRMS
jgi:hypothetical protein